MFRGVGAMSISQELGKLLYITKHSWNVINVTIILMEKRVNARM